MKFWKLFAICPFWQPNRKQPPPHPALPYDATAGAPHSAAPALFHTIAPVRFMMPGTHRPITPYPCLFATLHLCRSMAPCAYRPTAPYLRHTMLPSPTPLTVPRQVRLAPLGTAPELLEVWKQKSDQNCNFFAIGNCRRYPNHGSSPENEAKMTAQCLISTLRETRKSR